MKLNYIFVLLLCSLVVMYAAEDFVPGPVGYHGDDNLRFSSDEESSSSSDESEDEESSSSSDESEDEESSSSSDLESILEEIDLCLHPFSEKYTVRFREQSLSQLPIKAQCVDFGSIQEIVELFSLNSQYDNDSLLCSLCQEKIFAAENKETCTSNTDAAKKIVCHKTCLDSALSVETFLQKGYRASCTYYGKKYGLSRRTRHKNIPLGELRSLKGLECQESLEVDNSAFLPNRVLPIMNTLENVTTLILDRLPEGVSFRDKEAFPPNLQELFVRESRLKKVPPIAGLLHLERVNISRNDEIFFSDDDFPSSIKELYASGCELVSVPEKLNRLEQLAVLDLSNNNIKSIRHGTLPTQNMKDLNLSNNVLDIVPFDIHNMQSLETLNLGGNTQIARVTQGSLPTNLQSLNMINCQLCHVDGITELKKLKRLCLYNHRVGLKDLLPLRSFNRTNCKYDGTRISGIDNKTFEDINYNPWPCVLS